MSQGNGFDEIEHLLSRGRGRPLGTRKAYEIGAIWARRKEIVRRNALGQSNVEIAREMGITPQTVKNAIHDPLTQGEIRKMASSLDEEVVDIMETIRKHEPEALEYLRKVMTGEVESASTSLRAKTAENWLAKGGHGPLHKQLTMSGQLTKSDIEEYKERQRRSAAEAKAIAVDYEEVT